MKAFGTGIGQQSVALMLGALSGIMFAVNGLFINLLNGSVDAIFLQFMRMNFMAIVYTIFAIIKNVPFLSYSFKDYVFISALTTFHTVVLSCQFKSLQMVDLTDAVTIAATQPVFVAIFNFIFYRKRMSCLDFIQLILCVAGCILCTQPNFLFRHESESSVSDYTNLALGYFLAFVPAAGMALWTLAMKKNEHIDRITMAAASNINGAVVTALYLFAVEQSKVPTTSHDIILTASIAMASLAAVSFFYMSLGFGSALIITIGQTSTEIGVSAILNFAVAHGKFNYLRILGCFTVAIAVITPTIVELGKSLKTRKDYMGL